MKEVVINSFEELQDLVFKNCYDEKTGRYRNNFVYRGMGDVNFSLKSKFNRVCAHDLSLEDSVNRSFIKYGYADLQNIGSFWQILATGQHFGLPTRLLDWTYSPLIAAHFATEHTSQYDRDGVIYAVDVDDSFYFLPDPLKKELEDSRASIFTISLLEKHVKTLDQLKNMSEDPFFLFYEPASTDNRMINQYALFSMCSRTDIDLVDLMDRNPNNSLYRIIIPKEVKLEIRDKLDYINISERVIYPGLDGICSWITRRYADLRGK